MREIAFKIMGGYVLFFAAGMLFAGVLALAGNLPRLAPTVSPLASYIRMFAFIFFAALVGWGLFYLKKWAALVFSALTLYAAFWAIRSALEPSVTPGDATWLGYVYGVLLIVPAILTAKYWRTLVWR